MIELNNISVKYGELQILKNFNMTFDDKKITCIFGPSGVGKTTIATIVSGLIVPDSGKVSGTENAVYSYVFQEPRLLEWYSVYDNIDFVLKDTYEPEERRKIANNYIDMVGLTDFKNYQPNALSGGMAQRVSIARAFAYPSNVMIMDEPFKGLDIKLKQEMILLFQKLWNESKRTVIFITHDIDEAIFLSHTIYIIKNCPAEVVKKVDDIYEKDKLQIKESLKSNILND